MSVTKSLSLLYIEDNNDTRENITAYLTKHGYQVNAIDNAEAACDLFRTQRIDIILTDLTLPGQSGIDFVRCLRGKNIQTPVVITTAHTDAHFLMEAINLDVTRYLVKPIRKSDLLQALRIANQRLYPFSVSSFTPLHDGFSYDPVNKSIQTPAQAPIQLSKKEYALLELLLSQKNQIVPYEMIENIVWHNTTMSIDALRTLVRGVRKKTYNDIIMNVNGIGYKIDL